MTYFICSTGAEQEGKMVHFYSGLDYIPTETLELALLVKSTDL